MNNILFRASSMGDIMTGVAKGWDIDHSLTCKRKLIQIYRELTYGRTGHINSKYTEKGLQQEEDGITLYSRVTKRVIKKNTLRLNNEFFTGEFDAESKDATIDIKCVWSLKTLPHPLTDSADNGYIYQGQVYMDLKGMKKHIIAYCLINAPGFMVTKEKEKIYYNMGCPDHTSRHFDRYQLECKEVEKDMIFDYDQFMRDNINYDLSCTKQEIDIPLADRVVEFTVDYNEEMIEAMKSRVTACREWMAANLFKTLVTA